MWLTVLHHHLKIKDMKKKKRINMFAAAIYESNKRLDKIEKVLFSPTCKVKEPDFINSLGEAFYYGDTVWYILIKHGKLCSTKFEKHIKTNSNNHMTEIMTKESAQKWVEDQKWEYENRGIYKMILLSSNEIIIVMYIKKLGKFITFGDALILPEELKIIEKITL